MVDLIAASSLSQVPELIADCGGDADEVFGRLGVDREVVGAYDRFVPFTTVSTLVGTCARELGVPDFGLRLAARQHPDILGPLAIVARNAKTIGEALNKVAEFAHVYSPAITTTLVDDGRSVHNEFGTVPKRVPYRPHVMELALGVSLSTIRMLSDDQFHPTRVEVTHLPIAPEATYRAYFGCPVKFGAARDCMRFSSSLMRQRLRQIDPLAHDLALRFLMGRDRDTAFEDVVTALVVRSLPTGSARLASGHAPARGPADPHRGRYDVRPARRRCSPGSRLGDACRPRHPLVDRGAPARVCRAKRAHAQLPPVVRRDAAGQAARAHRGRGAPSS